MNEELKQELLGTYSLEDLHRSIFGGDLKTTLDEIGKRDAIDLLEIRKDVVKKRDASMTSADEYIVQFYAEFKRYNERKLASLTPKSDPYGYHAQRYEEFENLIFFQLAAMRELERALIIVTALANKMTEVTDPKKEWVIGLKARFDEIKKEVLKMEKLFGNEEHGIDEAALDAGGDENTEK